MLTCEIQRESRIGENPTYGLVCEVKPTERRRRTGGFTLIERTPSKGSASLLAECANSANFPIQADSLACAAIRATETQSGVTKSRDGKLVRFANNRVSAKMHSPCESPLDGGKSTSGTSEGLLASQNGKTNMQAVG